MTQELQRVYKRLAEVAPAHPSFEEGADGHFACIEYWHTRRRKRMKVQVTVRVTGGEVAYAVSEHVSAFDWVHGYLYTEFTDKDQALILNGAFGLGLKISPSYSFIRAKR